jgi:hypothetical protein
MLWGVVFSGFAFFTASGLFGRHLGIVESYLPLPEANLFATGGGGGGGEAPDRDETGSYSEALALGQKKKKPVMLEFTAFS